MCEGGGGEQNNDGTQKQSLGISEVLRTSCSLSSASFNLANNTNRHSLSALQKCVFVEQITQTTKAETNSYKGLSNFSTTYCGPIETKSPSFLPCNFILKLQSVKLF